jgi:hypothetical protein
MKLYTLYGYLVPDNGAGWSGQNPCHCCGMTYRSEVKTIVAVNAGLGIRVLGGKHLEEGTKFAPTSKKETVVKHVETKQGTITVITRSIKHADKS